MRFLRQLALSLLGFAMTTATTVQSQANTATAIPSVFATADAPSQLWFAGVEVAMRNQLLIDPAHIVNLVGQDIVGFALRRDAGPTAGDDSRIGGQSDWIVRLSTFPRAGVGDAANDFALNVGQDVREVHRGVVSVPSSPPTAGRSVAFGSQDAIRVSFPNSPFRYSAGVLCLDVEGSPVIGLGSPDWSVDAITESIRGTSTSIGQGCQDPLQVAGGGNSLSVPDRSLIVGQSAKFRAWVAPHSTAFLLVGSSLRSTPLDLSVFGAPGCELYLDPIATTALATSAPEFSTRPTFGAIAAWSLLLPNDPALFGLRVTSQAAVLQGVNLATTNAVDSRVASAIPTLGMSIVSGRTRAGVIPTTGRVRRDVGFVIEFEHR